MSFSDGFKKLIEGAPGLWILNQTDISPVLSPMESLARTDIM